MTGPIDFADITVGMQLTATTTWTATGASSATTATVVGVERNVITLSNGDTVVAPEFADPGTTVGFNLDEDAPAPPPPAPALGTIYTDETGKAWQATGTADALVMSGIDGTSLGWVDFLAAHPSPVLMEDIPVTPLPDPVSPYPQTIAPGDARLGMDLRVTVTNDTTGDTKIVRGVCPWIQDNPPPTDDFPSFLFLPGIGGEQLIADPAVVAVFDQQVVRDQASGRFVVQYDPLPAGIALTVEQMQDWTADSVWDTSGIPEPPVGGIVRSKNGIAWQRVADATADDPDGWYQTGQGMWSSVVGDYPRSFLWLWGAAAPFNVQEPA